MKLAHLRISNFQSFAKTPSTVHLEKMTFLLGPNGAGKTAVLQALARLFGFDRSLRNIRRSDFHVSVVDKSGELVPERLWIEAQFEFPELKEPNDNHATIPSFFGHMQLVSSDRVPRIRIRLNAEMDEEGEIEETVSYVIETDKDEEPTKMAPVSKHDRNAIQVHYLPARRDPADHVSYAATSLLGRALRSANWMSERESVTKYAQEIGTALAENSGVEDIGKELAKYWESVHKGAYFTTPNISFECGEIDRLLRHLTIGFTPGEAENIVDFSRLSDGQKSLLYLTMVLSLQAIGRKVLANELNSFDLDKLRPALFTLIAIEEPENSLSPHYLGRIIKALDGFANHHDAQSIVATHAPSLLKRVSPEKIRYLRLNADRETVVKYVVLPDNSSEAHKFVREAVQAFPELYFSRLVILGEGDSEEIVLPRFLQANNLGCDEASVSIVPLGGRHVNHFWRLLHTLEIPQLTLLDLDLGRHGGGWGRIKYVVQQLLQFPTIQSNLSEEHLKQLPKWNEASPLTSKDGQDWIKFLESAGVFFSSPLDLDFAMLRGFPDKYSIDDEELESPDGDILTSVLGKKHGDIAQYSDEEQEYFEAYHRRFKLGSKPAAHLSALAQLDDAQINEKMPAPISRLIAAANKKIVELPE